ncbi:helix-turn-helix transcriptional regulator [Nocardia sp. NPDC004722]
MTVYMWLRPEFEGRESELMLMSQVASELGVATGTVSNWRRRHARDFPPVVAMVGHLVYVVRAEMREFVAGLGYTLPEAEAPTPSVVWHRPEFKDRPSLLMNLAEVGEQFGVTRQAVSLWRQQCADFPPVVAEGPRLVLVVRTEIEAWVLGRQLERAERTAIRKSKTKHRRPSGALAQLGAA